MTVREVVHLQNNGADADDVRRFMATLSGDAEGIIEAGDLVVTEKSGTPNMSVDVAAGRALILGTQNTLQGTYFVENDAVVNLAVTAADPTNPRKDLVVVEVRDSFYTGGAPDDGRLAIVTGLAASPALRPALPENSLELNEIDVAAGATSIVNAKLNESRVLWVQNRAGSILNAALAAGIDAAKVTTGTLPTARLDTVAFEGRLSSAQSIPNNVLTAVSWTSEVTDTHNGHLASGTTWTVPAGQAGWYMSTFNYNFEDTASVAAARIVAGGDDFRPGLRDGNLESDTITILTQLAVGETVFASVHHSSGGAKNLDAAYLSILRLR